MDVKDAYQIKSGMEYNASVEPSKEDHQPQPNKVIVFMDTSLMKLIVDVSLKLHHVVNMLLGMELYVFVLKMLT